MNFNAFEQFRILLNKTLQPGSIDISLTNLSSLLLVTTLFLIGISLLIRSTFSFIPNNYQILFETFYLFIFSIIKEQTGFRGYKYLPHFYTVFITILSYNLIGLIPFGFTTTAHLIITFTLGLSFWTGYSIIGIVNLRSKFIYVFCPKNMPAWLLPLLTLVETISYLLRAVSLSLRLFANMLAGHILLHILGNAVIYLKSISLFLLLPILLILTGIGILELGISILQAYIFTILLIIYLKDSLISHV